MCEHIKPFLTKTKFCLLMHPKEAKKEKTGTGRATHRFLKNSDQIVDNFVYENIPTNIPNLYNNILNNVRKH